MCAPLKSFCSTSDDICYRFQSQSGSFVALCTYLLAFPTVLLKCVCLVWDQSAKILPLIPLTGYF